MDQEKEKQQIKNGGKEAKQFKPNIISRILFCWVCPVLFNGNRRDVEESDLIAPPSKKYNSETLGDRLER